MRATSPASPFADRCYAHITSPSPTPSLPLKSEAGDANNLSFTMDDELSANDGHRGDRLRRSAAQVLAHASAALPAARAASRCSPSRRARACRCIELQRHHDCEAEEALRHEEERQRHLQAGRGVERRRDEEEDAARKAFLDFEIKRATSERRWHK
ncbi:hypothetical protein EV121DRAFT_290753 [Schizophyllum commune]